MKYNRVIVWFKNDLRLHDNAALFSACKESSEIIPVYCFDPRQFNEVELGIQKTGSFRAKFLLEAVDNLRSNLIGLKSNLILRIGKPEEQIPLLAEEIQAEAVYFSEEVTQEEKNVENALENALWKKGVQTRTFWQSTLFHIEDLPFPVNQTPEVFTQFRKECEKFSKVRKTIQKPKSINFPEISCDLGLIPELSTLGLQEPASSKKGVLPFTGGEDAAMQRLQTYFWENDSLKTYKETRNGLLGPDYSSKFSAWLALGCISPRFIYEEVNRYETLRKKNDSTYWLVFELIWRDYFRFVSKKHGSKIFSLQGIKNHVDNWRKDEKLFWNWAEGSTGIPFVDANMRELNETGFISNRGRQNVASFLVNDLGIDWRWGAMYFESQLIDYDVCSNWGNWMYVAGVGNDPRENRYFNILKQANIYDKKGDFIRHWIPELGKIPGFDIHQPDSLTKNELRSYGVHLGANYPHPIVAFSTREKWTSIKN
ncbi:DASH family cryptochrome [Aquiflexum sp. TKW24L]|uniref:DASH family cryptochrome n=1 Tax=Aquiflexum sp. TKW24L TaxID=2942212 RepID=UPI0020C0AC2E|nr:DASH family cryptochrome [Aquiflexum sp. TKW24L]MCL6260483.1 DASH family cryptochrome [Aquiflexum sp. TKW24L]